MHALFNQSLRRIRFGVGCALGAVAAPSVVLAAEPSNAAASSPAAMAAPAPAAAAHKYTVKEGDTLDKVIRMHMGNSPLRIEILREAVMQQNPQAFAKGSNKFLLANAVLTLPNHHELVQKQLAAVLPPAEPAPPAATTSSYTEDRRKSWVRYP